MTTARQSDEDLEAQVRMLQEKLEAAKQAVGHPIPPNAGDDPRYSEVMATFLELRRVRKQLAYGRRHRLVTGQSDKDGGQLEP